MKKNIIVEIICYLLIILFVYAAVNKISDVQKFQSQIGQSPLLTAFAPFVAWFIPIIEIVVSLMLSISRFRLAGLYASFSLMVMFSTYIVAILQFSEYIPCSCGGVLSKMGWTEHLIFNLGFTILAFIGIILQAKIVEGRSEDKIIEREVMA